MAYCKRMKRVCDCGALVTYDSTGRLAEPDNGPGCLSDEEVRCMLTVLLREWRTRCHDAELESFPTLMPYN